jgi:leader peptidase (prepilin peptidase)/N-methyltransferase
VTGAAIALAAVLGLVIGSFLTVVISRIPEGLSIATPGSRCPICMARIRPMDNIPVVSYLLRHGRCRNCNAPISIRYPATELATALLFAIVTVRVPELALAPAYCVLAAGLVALTAIDLQHFRLPTPIVLTTAFVGLPLLALGALLHHNAAALVRVPIAGAVAFAVFGLIFIAVPRGMGFGDVRLAAVCAAYLGYLGYREATVGFLSGFVIAGVVAIALVLFGRAGRRTRVPFGPFLALGTVIAVLFGAPLARAWLG